jgi:hypothetical protein
MAGRPIASNPAAAAVPVNVRRVTAIVSSLGIGTPRRNTELRSSRIARHRRYN